MIRIVATAIAWLALTTAALAADRFWVGGTGTWDGATTTHWSLTTGGAGGASVPGFGDRAVFDASSGGGTVTANNSGGVTIGTLDMSAAGAMTFAGSGTTGAINFFIGGTLILGASVTYSNTSNILTNSNLAITSNGATWGGSLNPTAGTITITDDLTIAGAITFVSSATIDTSTLNKNLTAQSITVSSSAPTFVMGSSTWTFTGSGTPWNVDTSPTITPGTSTIKLTNSAITFAGGGKTYANIWFAHAAQAGTIVITGANTFANIKDDGTVAHIIQFPASTTTSASSISINGNSGQLISLNSSTGGTRFTLSVASGLVNPDFVSIKDSAATGGAIFDAKANAVNVSNNTGWFFNVPLPASTFSLVPL